jgi:hypothetical protein
MFARMPHGPPQVVELLLVTIEYWLELLLMTRGFSGLPKLSEKYPLMSINK